MAREPFFKGLVFDEYDQPVTTAQVGTELFYVVNDAGFKRHIPSDQIDKAVLKQMTDQITAVILVQTAFGISQNLLILRGFFAAVPSELQDAASIDGCSSFGFFWRVLLPLVRPALAAVGALTMIVSWNDLLTPLVILDSESKWTLPLGTMQFQGQYSSDIAVVSAFVALSAIPAILFYIFAERQIVSGLTAGALKG